jgi:hypothetical protein
MFYRVYPNTSFLIPTIHFQGHAIRLRIHHKVDKGLLFDKVLDAAGVATDEDLRTLMSTASTADCLEAWSNPWQTAKI